MSQATSERPVLFRASPDDYGPDYKAHLLEEYKLYVEMHDRVSARRQSTNNYCVTIETALLALIGAVVERVELRPIGLVPMLALAGIMVSFYWQQLISSYGNLSRGKFHVILLLEKRLPVAPYEEEWKDLREGNDHRRYRPFTFIERRFPALFLFVFGGVLIWSIFGLVTR